MEYKYKERQRQENLIKNTSIFYGDKGNGVFRKRHYTFVLANGVNNLYAPIRNDVIKYFEKNHITWWGGGSSPSGHTLSSQIACLNHLFGIRNDACAVLSLVNNIRSEFIKVLPIPCDAEPYSYISFEVVSDNDYLNEKYSYRGKNCTSIDALIYAQHKNGQLWLIPIEWKYTESYATNDKSNEDRHGEAKGTNGKGLERLRRYTELIHKSQQLKSVEHYGGSVYFQEPFYQLMRQTLWAENMVSNKNTERLKADDYLHIHVVPKDNQKLLDKLYKVSGMNMEDTWRSMLIDEQKYVLIDPQNLMHPLSSSYMDLYAYLNKRYWGNI